MLGLGENMLNPLKYAIIDVWSTQFCHMQVNMAGYDRIRVLRCGKRLN